MPECEPYYAKLIAVAKLQISFALCPDFCLIASVGPRSQASRKMDFKLVGICVQIVRV